ncbi:crotonase/enoyl-CoA hydratase family protein [Pseudaestuariivita atlantica]|uniref:Enoyl-CoA hydratase n=1 Tax=Pseudaestuariivita atlantica TaxID=1317121 RepID=A0A0L1JQD3_9RHOB|nr:crotonase/enoyl-CoA hydratase family protein [Pseudaestuariivita atlantica]KNG93951.1 enoyl-CoA hydratase [Pseudaestuariivita atlantica]
MQFETLEIERDARGVATLWLNRPDTHNAMSSEMLAELVAATEALGADPDVRVVVLAGRGRSFSAGADLGWMRAQFGMDATTRAAESAKLGRMLKALNEMPKPLIGRVHGHAIAGGLGLLSVCDAVIAVPGVKMALTETKLGIVPANIGPYVVAKIGVGAARRIFMSARTFSTDEALAMGLVSRVVDPEALDAAIEDEIAPYLACAPGAVAEAKRLLLSFADLPDEARIAELVNLLAARWETDEAQEGITAFFDKRKPGWAAD